MIHIHAQYPHMTYHEYRPIMIEALLTYQGNCIPIESYFLMLIHWPTSLAHSGDHI